MDEIHTVEALPLLLHAQIPLLPVRLKKAQNELVAHIPPGFNYTQDLPHIYTIYLEKFISALLSIVAH